MRRLLGDLQAALKEGEREARWVRCPLGAAVGSCGLQALPCVALCSDSPLLAAPGPSPAPSGAFPSTAAALVGDPCPPLRCAVRPPGSVPLRLAVASGVLPLLGGLPSAGRPGTCLVSMGGAPPVWADHGTGQLSQRPGPPGKSAGAASFPAQLPSSPCRPAFSSHGSGVYTKAYTQLGCHGCPPKPSVHERQQPGGAHPG